MNQELSNHLQKDSVVLREDNSNGITKITLNRPDQYNALTEELLHSLKKTLRSIGSDDSVRVVILASAGKAFCAGHDLKELRSQPEETYYNDLFQLCSEVMIDMVKLPQPIIAQVQGMATAAGCQLVANSDLAIASTNAQFAVSGINLGLFCSTPSVPLTRSVSRKHAFEMLMTGRFINAETAAEFGLINQVVSPDKLCSIVADLAKNIASKPTESIRVGKAVFYEQIEQGLSKAYATAGKVMAANMMFDQTQEGIDAFIGKRDPDWD